MVRWEPCFLFNQADTRRREIVHGDLWNGNSDELGYATIGIVKY